MQLRLIGLAACLVLAGCVTDPAVISAEQDGKCRGFGYQPGTEAYAGCRLQLHQMSEVIEARRQARVASAISESIADGQRQRQESARALSQTLQQQPQFGYRPAVTCRSRPVFGGQVETVCQ